MASGRKMAPEIIASDSEESEVEGGVESLRSHHYPRHIMELMYEMEVREYYRKMQESRKASHVAMRSKACQTNPDTSTIPPSWILLGEKLACELRTGLGNLINRLHTASEEYGKGRKKPRADRTDSGLHTASEEYCKGLKRQRADSGRMQYFRYVNGHLESRLLPGVKIPESAVLDNCMGYLKELELLLEKACKLSIIMPCIAEVTQTYLKQVQENEALLAKMVKKGESKITGAEVNYSVIQGAPCCSRKQFVPSLEELPEISDENSIMPGCSSNKDFITSTKPKFQISRLGNYAAGTAQNAGVNNRKFLNGTPVSKHHLPSEKPTKMKGAKKVLFSSDIKEDPTSSRGPNYERKPLAANAQIDEPSSSRVTIRTGNGQENHSQAQSSTTKNFIKKNILAVKTAVVTRSGKVYRGL